MLLPTWTLALAFANPGDVQPPPAAAPVPYYSESHGYINAVDGGKLTHRGEHFELVGTISALYAQVWWAPLPDVKTFPADIVKRFDGKVMAITGFETQVTRIDNATGHEMAVPCSDLYNHHWNLRLAGASAAFSPEEVDAAKARHMGREEPPALPRSAPPPDTGGIPVRQVFSEANGNEHRGTFHGTPRGYAQLLRSPATVSLLHMSINTRNPAGHRLDPQAAPQPRGSNSRLPAAGEGWSGVLECPCTDRVARPLPGFRTGCVPEGALERQNNTICREPTYRGGVRCCGDKVVLLDRAQAPPPTPDVYLHKLRIYFEEYEPRKVRNAFRLYWQTEEWSGEYDVPQCAAGTPPQQCVHTLTSRLRAADLFGGLSSPLDPRRLNCSLVTDVWCGQISDVEAAGGRFKLLYMAFHQHSPAVLSGELINADTGALICRSVPLYGTTVGAPLDEKSYAYGIPPCVWGGADEGLPPPPLLSLETNLLVIAKYNSSVPHTGVMAMWQGRGGI